MYGGCCDGAGQSAACGNPGEGVANPRGRARRDKTRMLLAEALTLAAGAVPGADAGAVAVDVELAMLRQVRARARPRFIYFIKMMQLVVAMRQVLVVVSYGMHVVWRWFSSSWFNCCGGLAGVVTEQVTAMHWQGDVELLSSGLPYPCSCMGMVSLCAGAAHKDLLQKTFATLSNVSILMSWVHVQAGGSANAGYKATFRRLVANLREASNPDLRRRVLARDITGMPHHATAAAYALADCVGL